MVSTKGGGILIRGRYIHGSKAMGLLIVIYNTHNHSMNPLYQLVPYRSEEVEYEITGLRPSDYAVSIFVVGNDGLPYSMAASTPKLVAIVYSKHQMNMSTS